MSKVNIWPTLEVASRQIVAATDEVTGPVASRSVGEHPRLV